MYVNRWAILFSFKKAKLVLNLSYYLKWAEKKYHLRTNASFKVIHRFRPILNYD